MDKAINVRETDMDRSDKAGIGCKGRNALAGQRKEALGTGRVASAPTGAE